MGLHLLIVDDEELTRLSLRDYISWSDFGIDRVSVSSNGAAALDIARMDAPDILLTDVRMPRMDGIALAAALRELHPSCRIVFISGYSDKEYLKSAIALKAERYIEKPINMVEVSGVFREITDQIRDERHSRTNMLTTLRAMEPHIRQEIALALIRPGFDAAALVAKVSDSYFDWPAQGHYHAVCLQIREEAALPALVAELGDELQKLLEPRRFFLAPVTEAEAALLIQGAEADELPKKHLAACLERMGAFRVAAGIADPCRALTKLAERWEQARGLVRLSFYTGYGILIDESYPRSRSPVSFSPADLPEQALEGSAEALGRLLDQLREKRFADVGCVQELLYGIYRRLAADIRGFGGQELAKKDFLGLTLYQLRELLSGGVSPGASAQESARNAKVDEAVCFIHRSYHSGELSIKAIAEEVGLTQNYLCTLFRQVTGKTINDYVLELRLKKVRSLLRGSSLRLYEIAAQVGYEDANYLSALFKKHVGMTPSRYRNSGESL